LLGVGNVRSWQRCIVSHDDAESVVYGWMAYESKNLSESIIVLASIFWASDSLSVANIGLISTFTPSATFAPADSSQLRCSATIAALT